MAVIQCRQKHAGVRRHFTKFCQHRPEISLSGMHGARARHTSVLRHRQTGLRTLHRDCRIGLKRFWNEPEQPKQRLAQSRRERVIRIRVIPEEWRDYIHLKRILNGSSRRIECRPAAHGTDGALEFIGVHCRHLSVVVKVVKWFVDTIEILEIGEYQQLTLSKSFSLVDGKWSGFVLIARLSKRAEC